MEISYEEGKLNFILDLFFPLEKMLTGGLVVLHKLAYKLAEKGHNVFIFCEPEYPHPNIKTIRSEVKTEENSFIINYSWESFNYPVKNTVAIYPQIIISSTTFKMCKIGKIVNLETMIILLS